MAEEKNPSPKDLISLSLQTGNAIVDDGKKSWNLIVEQILQKKGVIIALRGAGSVNGMDPDEAKTIVRDLVSRIKQIQTTSQQVTVLFDGDSDSPQKPDVGYVAGRLLDEFGEKGVTFIAAQKRSWYYPNQEGGNLANAAGKSYPTYVFDDEKYPGDHNAFTQDERLVASPFYEQWYIGASGQIANNQLQNFNDKVPLGQQRSVTFFRVRNNHALDQDIRTKLSQAQASSDASKITRFQGQLAQRENIYGVHFDNQGNPTVQQAQYPNLRMQFISR